MKAVYMSAILRKKSWTTQTDFVFVFIKLINWTACVWTWLGLWLKLAKPPAYKKMSRTSLKWQHCVTEIWHKHTQVHSPQWYTQQVFKYSTQHTHHWTTTKIFYQRQTTQDFKLSDSHAILNVTQLFSQNLSNQLSWQWWYWKTILKLFWLHTIKQ